MSQRFEEFCPKLVSGDYQFSGGRLLFTAINGTQISLPTNAKMILELCDGSHTIRQIASKMLVERKSLPFRLLMETLEALKKVGLLEDEDHWPSGETSALNTDARSWWRKCLFAITLSKSRKNPRPSHGLFSLLVLILITAGIYRILHLLPWNVPQNFLRLGDSYLTGIFFLIAAISIFRLGKGLCQGALIWTMTGRPPQMTLELQPLGLSVETNAHDVWEGSPVQHLGFALASSIAPLAIAADFFLLFPDALWQRDLGILAMLWSFFELSPFRGSDFTWFFSRRAHGAHSDHLEPFLQKKSLFALFKSRDVVEGEKTLLAFASLSILWVFGFLFFCLSVFNAGFAHLFADLNVDLFGGFIPAHASADKGVLGTSLGDSAAAGILLLTILFLMLSWLHRVTLIFFSNALDPLQGSLKSIARNIGSTEESASLELVPQLNQFPIFNQVPGDSLAHTIQNAKFKTFKRGTRILIQGEEGEEAYILLRGAADVERHENTGLVKKLATLGPGAVFGEMGLIKKTLRTADVVAAEDCYAMLLTIELLDKLKEHTGDKQTVLDRIFISQHMASSDLFKHLPAEVIHLFANKGVVEHLDPEKVIIEQDEIGTDFYLLLRGKVAILKNQNQIKSIEQGGFFGEIALLADIPRTATVKTTEATSVLKIDSASFWDVLSSNINMATLIENVAESRLEEGQQARSTSP